MKEIIIQYLYLAESVIITRGNTREIDIINPAVRSIVKTYDLNLDEASVIFGNYSFRVSYDKKYGLWNINIAPLRGSSTDYSIIIRYIFPAINYLKIISDSYFRSIRKGKTPMIIKPFYIVKMGANIGRFSKIILQNANYIKTCISTILPKIISNQRLTIINTEFLSSEVGYDIILTYLLARDLLPIQTLHILDTNTKMGLRLEKYPQLTHILSARKHLNPKNNTSTIQLIKKVNEILQNQIKILLDSHDNLPSIKETKNKNVVQHKENKI